MRLYCDNLGDFLSGKLKFYTIDSGYASQGDVVTLYNEETEGLFEVIYTIQHDYNRLTLGLGLVE